MPCSVLCCLGLRVCPGVRRVAPGAVEVTAGDPHEQNMPARAGSLTLERRSEDLVDANHRLARRLFRATLFFARRRAISFGATVPP